MAREVDEGWLQWASEECIIIPRWKYCMLGLLWPIIKLYYTKALLGQHTNY